MAHALSGLKVVEFAMYAAGPVIGKYFANHGAQVVHVEAPNRPDGFRLQYPPFKDNRRDLNAGGLFSLCNDSKYGITLDLKHPDSEPVKRRLVQWADIIIENFTPGTIQRLGLDYRQIQPVNPRLIIISTSNMGQVGPMAHHPGFGSQLTSYAGLTHLTGYPDDPPALLYGPYIDYIAVGLGLVAVLAALDYRRRHQRGQYIDLSQYAAGLHFMAAPLLNYQVNGRIASRQGNWHPSAVPHGVYPTNEVDRWVVIGIYHDHQWMHLKDIVGYPPESGELETLIERRQYQGDIDRWLADWSRQNCAEHIVEVLTSREVPAAIVRKAHEVYDDPQLNQRELWQKRHHPVLGDFHYEGPAWILSGTPWEITTPSPLLGEHNVSFYRDCLGYTEEEIEELARTGVIGEVRLENGVKSHAD